MSLRQLFHDIANSHNKVTMASSGEYLFLQDEPLDGLNHDQLKQRNKELVAALDNIKKDTMQANEQVMKLKDIIYKKIDPDTVI